MTYPTQFEDTRLLDVDAKGSVAELGARGFEIFYGLDQLSASAINQMANEPAIREYCPNDCADRFKDLASTEKWLSKGRATFTLKNRDGLLVGYGWTGAGKSSEVPGGETTFAIRIGQAAKGQGLATPFAKAIVFGSAEVFGSKDFWLETWQSNAGAVHVYHKIGFQDVDAVASERQSASGEMTKDTRLYMSLPNQLLAN